MVQTSVNRSFWSGRRVLLTGHTGFKGAWAQLWLERLGARVTGFALPPATDPSLHRLVAPHLRGTSIEGDLRDPDAVAQAIEQADPELVLHMGAQALVRRAYAEPVETFGANLSGTVNLLQALRGRPKLRAILVVTTDKVYENREDGRPFVESDPLGGHDPYSASKAAAELAVSAFAHSYFAPAGIALATARAGNVIGGGDWAEDRLIPDIWRTLTSGRPLELRYPQATRPWQHVLDPLAGYLLYLEHLAENAGRDLPPALNFGPANNESLSVAVIAEHMLNLLAPKQAWVPAQGKAPPEKQALALDASLAGRALGWQPRLAARQALAWTAGWYRSNLDGGDPYAATLADIARYEAL